MTGLYCTAVGQHVLLPSVSKVKITMGGKASGAKKSGFFQIFFRGRLNSCHMSLAFCAMVVLHLCQKLDANMGHSPAEAREDVGTHPCHAKRVVKTPKRRTTTRDMGVSKFFFLDFGLNMLDLGTLMAWDRLQAKELTFWAFTTAILKFAHGTTV